VADEEGENFSQISSWQIVWTSPSTSTHTQFWIHKNETAKQHAKAVVLNWRVTTQKWVAGLFCSWTEKLKANNREQETE